MDDFWEWNPEKKGYEPRSNEWWSWDTEQHVLRPLAHDGWVFDAKANEGRGAWSQGSTKPPH